MPCFLTGSVTVLLRMRFGITSKLFFAILASCIAVAIAMGIAVRISFEHGFQEYVQERDARRAAVIGEVLADIHREAGSWEPLRENPRAWWRILRSAPDDRNGAGPQGSRQQNEGYTPAPPFYLVDASERLVAGNPAGSAGLELTPRYPIDVDGKTVGWLVKQPRGQAPNALDERFLAQQLKATWMISALSVVLAALVSVLLARTMLTPLRRLGRATKRLAAGDYGTRVQVKSQDELGQLARDFNRLALTLERNERLRRDMMADISHELRTPLAILRGELEALQDGVRTLSPDSLASLHVEVDTLNKLIDDLHEFSLADIGALNYRLTDVDAAGLLRTACQAFRERLASKQIVLEIGLPQHAPTIKADAHRLTQLFNNLLENSVRYTDSGGTLQVAMHSDARELHITLQDSAPGVPDELLPRLFERLFRVESSRNRHSGGSGLGLAISRRIVEAHGGRIEALPSGLGGVCIAITFPLSRD